MGKTIDDRLGCDVSEGNGLGPSRETVYDCQQIWKAIGRRDSGDVCVKVAEATGRYDKLADGWDGVTTDLRPRAIKTLACPLGCIATK